MEPLIAALNDNNKYVRKFAAKALFKIGDARAVEPLIVALKDSDIDVRCAAAEALGKIGDARAVEPLIGALRNRKSSCVGRPSWRGEAWQRACCKIPYHHP